MKRSYVIILLMLISLLGLSSCATDPLLNYPKETTGRLNLALKATVLSARDVSVGRKQGIEYVVEAENGNLMTIVQTSSSVFEQGQKVFVLYGSTMRIIADPRAVQVRSIQQ